MFFIYSPKYQVDLGSHPFRTEKYRLVHDALIKQGFMRESGFIEPEPATIEDLLLVHTRKYIDDLKNLCWTPRTLRSELPLTREIVEAFILSAGGTILTARKALEKRKAIHIGGGWHHAFPDHGEGFCYLNDVAIAIRKLQKEGKIQKAMIIDCDLHQGNGNARIFQSDKNVFTFSIHQENLYPVKEKSDLDIGLPDFAGDEEYLGVLRKHIPKILKVHQPDLVIYVAGADPYKEDQLGTLQLTMEGLKQRDRFIFQQCKGNEVPVGVVLAGGYASKLQDTVQIHLNTCKELLDTLAS